MSALKNVKTDHLTERDQELARHRRSLDLVEEESINLSSVARYELECVRRGLRIEHEKVQAELAVRARMLPDPTIAPVVHRGVR